MAQSAPVWALPTLRAATDPAATTGSTTVRADGVNTTGYPVRVDPSGQARDQSSQRRLWKLSEQLTGVSYLDVPYPEGTHAVTGQKRALPPR